MKKVGLIAAISLAALSVGAAFAADLPSHKAPPVYIPPPPPPPLWTGFYGGVNLGGGWTNNTFVPNYLVLVRPADPVVNPNIVNPVDPFVGTPFGAVAVLSNNGGGGQGGVVGGGQVGYNYQFGASFLIGGEADLQGTTIGGGGNNGWGAILVGRRSPAIDWFGTVRGRLGWLFTPTLLVYGTGGFAYGGVSTGGGWFGGSYSHTRTGWTAGGGVEWMFMPNWSAKAEYLYVDLDSSGTTGTWGWNWGYHRHPQINVVRAGVNYHFNWGAPAPVIAKY